MGSPQSCTATGFSQRLIAPRLYTFVEYGEGKMPVGYTYITRSATGWVYGGKRESATFDKSYFGSGRRVINHIKKHGGTHLLTCEVVAFYETVEELNDGERKLIAELREIYDQLCVNINDGGNGHTKESAKRAAQNTEWRAKRKEAMQRKAQDHEWRANQKKGCQRNAQNPEWREKHKAAMQRKGQDPEYRKRQREASKAASERIKIEVQKWAEDLFKNYTFA